MHLHHGERIGLYRVEGVLGSGGMGQVFKVRHTVTSCVHALKVVVRDGPNGVKRTERFLQEVQIQAGMKHPGVPVVYNAFWERNALVMVMELVEGKSLEQLLKERPISLPESLGYTFQVLDVLGHLHARNVVHRDISPGNLMVGWDGKIRLTDFGLAKVVTDDQLGEAGVVMGAAYYMSPEQVRGDASIDHRSDLYSFGVVLYELLTGKKPFNGDNHYSVMRAHIEQQPVPPAEINPSIPPELNQAISTAIAKDPGKRFQSSAQFRKTLERTREHVRYGAWNPASIWDGISEALQKLVPASPIASDGCPDAVLAGTSSFACGAPDGAEPAPLPPALRELASSLSHLSGSRVIR